MKTFKRGSYFLYYLLGLKYPSGEFSACLLIFVEFTLNFNESKYCAQSRWEGSFGFAKSCSQGLLRPV